MGTQALGDRTLDVRADRPDMRDRIYNPRLVSLPSSYPRDEFIAEQLPRYEAADLILDQGSEGACTGFGLAALINYLQFREAMKWEREARPRVSPRMLYHLARIYDEWPGEDRALETFAVPAVRPLWQQMKQNAVAASVDQGGLVAASEHLASLQRQHGAEIHLIGHSAGAVVLGPFLDLLAGAKVKVGSLSLFAPACTVAFAMRHFAPHIGKTVPADKVAIDVLSDANERNDEVGPYKKSLLYLVSRALEDTHKTPILGLQAVWHPPLDEKDILAGLDPKRRPTTSAADARLVPDAVTAWRQAWARWKGAKLGVLAAPEVSNGLTKEPANHGCFDNWADGIADTIIRIRGNPLKAPLPPLVGF